MRMPIIAATAILAGLPGIASAAQASCLTQQEFSDLAAYALPSALNGAAERCKIALGDGAFLSANGDKLVERYAAQKDKSWPAAKAAFLKSTSKVDGKSNALFKLMPDDTLQDMLDLMIEGMVSQEIPAEKCGTIDEFARLLAPLPPENTAKLLGLIVSLAGKPAKEGAEKSALGKLTICQEKS